MVLACLQTVKERRSLCLQSLHLINWIIKRLFSLLKSMLVITGFAKQWHSLNLFAQNLEGWHTPACWPNKPCSQEGTDASRNWGKPIFKCCYLQTFRTARLAGSLPCPLTKPLNRSAITRASNQKPALIPDDSSPQCLLSPREIKESTVCRNGSLSLVKSAISF